MTRRTVVAGGLSALVLGGGWAVAAVGPPGSPAPPGSPPVATEAALSSDAVAGRRPAPRLVRFRSCRAFAAHARARTMEAVGAYGLGADPARTIAPVAEGDVAGAAPALAAPREGVDFSGTNVQEAGVNEPDLVKTDGRTIFSVGGRAAAGRSTSPARRPGRLPGLDLAGMQPVRPRCCGRPAARARRRAAGPVVGPVADRGRPRALDDRGPGPGPLRP